MLSLRRSLLLVSTSISLAACSTVYDDWQSQSTGPARTDVASVEDPSGELSQLVDQIDFNYEQFTLGNGLTVLVNENRKSPIVSVGVWYNVGSKDEPAGKTGFAHLFEHLMFNGSENLPDDYFVYLQQIGATDSNGSTSYDRTNYYQTVPRGALERVLFMESDRMGYLLGAVTQEKLDNQRGVVQNEKRQGENRPGGLVFAEVAKALFPEGHPYHHTTIGSMADLDAASLGDVQRWFEDKYGPNNAVLVLSGDISGQEARPLVEKYFGAIDRGPMNDPASASVPTLNEPVRLNLKDRVATTMISKTWAVPGDLDDDAEALQLAGIIFGGLASSRLDNELVRGEQVAVQVSAGYQAFHRVGLFSINATVKAGQDEAYVEQRIDQLLGEFLTEGPTEDELNRAKTAIVSGAVRGMESVSAAGNLLAQGQLYEGEPEAALKSLERSASHSAPEVRAAAVKWLSGPAVMTVLEPGERPPYQEAAGARETKNVATTKYEMTPREIPSVGQTPPLDFPDVQHVRLSNGIELHYAQRSDVPLTHVSLRLDAGTAADPAGRSGLSMMTFSVMDEGAGSMDAQALAEAKEELGSRIGIGNGRDASSVTLSSLSTRLENSLDLMEMIVKEPRFVQADIDRIKAQRLAQLAQAKSDPDGMINAVLPRIIYGEGHPYATNGLGDETVISGVSADDLKRFHQAFVRPELAELFVVSDLPLETIRSAIEDNFGQWDAPRTARGVKRFSPLPDRPSSPRTILLDLPQSPQSTIIATQLLPTDPTAELIDAFSANEVLGGGFLSRLNMDLRETKGWSYGVNGSIGRNQHSVGYTISAPVQADRTADSILALSEQLKNFLTTEGVSADELERIVTNNIAQLPGQFETGASVLSAMIRNDELERSDNYYETLSEKYAAQTQAGLDTAIRDLIDPEGFIWVIVGDADVVGPQLTEAGIAFEQIEAAEPSPAAP